MLCHGREMKLDATQSRETDRFQTINDERELHDELHSLGTRILPPAVRSLTGIFTEQKHRRNSRHGDGSGGGDTGSDRHADEH